MAALSLNQRVKFCGSPVTVRHMGVRFTVSPGDTGQVAAQGELLGIWTVLVKLDDGPMIMGSPDSFEPFVPKGHAPSEFSSMPELMQGLASSTATDGSM